MSDGSVILVGGPASGKTNYIARLWLSFKARKGRLRAPQLPADIRYVNEAVQHLHTLRFVPRSNLNMDDGRHDFVIEVRGDEGAGPERSLTVPDITGELWKRAVETYELPQDWIDSLKGASSAILFIGAHSKLNVQPMDWVTAREHLQEHDGGDDESDDFDDDYGADEDEDGNPIPRGTVAEPAALVQADVGPADPIESTPDAASSDVGTAADLIGGSVGDATDAEGEQQGSAKAKLPAQVGFCELLRYLSLHLSSRADGSKPRVAVVVTAWDMLDAEARTAGPLEYLKVQFPLLAGRVRTPGGCEIQTFGMSIVGGNLRNPQFRATLKRRDLSEVGYSVVMRDGVAVEDPDITLPIAWALGD